MLFNSKIRLLRSIFAGLIQGVICLVVQMYERQLSLDMAIFLLFFTIKDFNNSILS